jgi:hypothetical protein
MRVYRFSDDMMAIPKQHSVMLPHLQAARAAPSRVPSAWVPSWVMSASRTRASTAPTSLHASEYVVHSTKQHARPVHTRHAMSVWGLQHQMPIFTACS